MKIISSFLIILFTVVSVASEGIVAKEEIVAKVNGKPIYLSEVEKMKNRIEHYNRSRGVRIPPSVDVFEIALNALIEEKLIMLEAEKEKIKVYDREVEKEIDEMRKNDPYFDERLRSQNITIDDLKNDVKKKIITARIFEQKIKPQIKPLPENEIKKFFDEIIKIMRSTSPIESIVNEEDVDLYRIMSRRFKEIFDERVRYRYILIRPSSYTEAGKKAAIEKAYAIKQRVLAGEDFEDIAYAESADRETAKDGGDAGYVIRGDLPESLEKVVFSLKPGEISDPIWTDSGYYVVEVVEKKIAEKPKFNLVKGDLENILMQKKYDEALQKYVEKLKSTAQIEKYKK